MGGKARPFMLTTKLPLDVLGKVCICVLAKWRLLGVKVCNIHMVCGSCECI